MQKPAILISLALLMLFSFAASSAHSKEQKYKVLATTFPMYLLTKNIINGSNDISLELLIPAELGCPHDYALSPKDMRKLSKADILIVNGLGLEEFLGAPLERANKDIRVINSSDGITGILHFTKEEQEPEASNHVEHSDLNPHIFASPDMSSELVSSIANKLSVIIPQYSALFETNAKKYADKMKFLSDELIKLQTTLKNNRIIQPHGIFDYIARKANLEIVATLQPHGEDPSASKIIQLIDTIKSKDVGAIIIEPQYPSKVARILSSEAGIPLIELDPVASGAMSSPDDLFFIKMKQNIDKLKETLKVKTK